MNATPITDVSTYTDSIIGIDIGYKNCAMVSRKISDNSINTSFVVPITEKSKPTWQDITMDFRLFVQRHGPLISNHKTIYIERQLKSIFKLIENLFLYEFGDKVVFVSPVTYRRHFGLQKDESYSKRKTDNKHKALDLLKENHHTTYLLINKGLLGRVYDLCDAFLITEFALKTNYGNCKK